MQHESCPDYLFKVFSLQKPSEKSCFMYIISFEIRTLASQVDGGVNGAISSAEAEVNKCRRWEDTTQLLANRPQRYASRHQQEKQLHPVCCQEETLHTEANPPHRIAISSLPLLSSRVCDSASCMDARINHALVKTRPVARLFCCTNPYPGNFHLEVVRPLTAAMAYSIHGVAGLEQFFFSSSSFLPGGSKIRSGHFLALVCRLDYGALVPVRVY